MQPVVALLRDPGASIAVRHAAGIDDLGQFEVEAHWYPELIVALQTWPDQFSAGEVRSLMSLAPLARIVCVYGAWCDSEGRTRVNWPLSVRVAVPGARERIVRELASIRGEAAVLPITAGRGEIFAADFGWPHRAALVSRQLAVASPDRRWRQMLSSAIASGGHPIVDLEDSTCPPESIVWDADPWDKARALSLQSLRNRFPHATIVASVGFMRDDLAEELRVAGADTVWFKLAPLSTLLPLLDTCTAERT
jgi:hypothetical protein